MIFDSSLPLFLCWLYSWFLSLFPPQHHQGMVSSPHTVSATPFPPQGEDSSPLPPTGNSPPQRFCFPFLSALSRRQPHCCWWAQPWSRAGAVSIGPRGGSWQLPTESTPEAPQYQTLATKPNPPTLQEVFSPLFWVHLSTFLSARGKWYPWRRMNGWQPGAGDSSLSRTAGRVQSHCRLIAQVPWKASWSFLVYFLS